MKINITMNLLVCLMVGFSSAAHASAEPDSESEGQGRRAPITLPDTPKADSPKLKSIKNNLAHATTQLAAAQKRLDDQVKKDPAGRPSPDALKYDAQVRFWTLKKKIYGEQKEWLSETPAVSDAEWKKRVGNLIRGNDADGTAGAHVSESLWTLQKKAGYDKVATEDETPATPAAKPTCPEDQLTVLTGAKPKTITVPGQVATAEDAKSCTSSQERTFCVVNVKCQDKKFPGTSSRAYPAEGNGDCSRTPAAGSFIKLNDGAFTKIEPTQPKDGENEGGTKVSP